MTSATFSYRLEQPGDSEIIDHLHASLFGPERFKRAAYVLRDGVPPDPALSFVATHDGRLVASVRMTPITIGGRPALLLGPLVVDPAFKGQGAGRTLVRMTCGEARRLGRKVVMLVGDEPYYGPLGFTFLGRNVITLPAWVDPDRVLVAGLTEDALDGLSGPAESVLLPAIPK
jgi:predicted N-acetyltransferase YhbS